MKQKLKKIKLEKLTKGSLTRNPELLVMLYLFRITGGYKIIGKYIEGLLKRGRKKKAEKVVNSLLGLYISGGKSIQDLDILHKDEGLERVLGGKYFYSPSNMTEILQDKLKESWKVINDLTLEYSTRLLWKQIKEKMIPAITIDIDATYMKNKGRDAKMNYKGELSMRAMTVSVKETSQMIYGYLDEGNNPAHMGLSETIKTVLGKFEERGILSKVEEVVVRSDSAGWLREFIQIIQGEYKQKFIIKVRNDRAMKEYYEENRKYARTWEKFSMLGQDGQNREYEATIVPYVMGGNPKKMVSFNVYLFRERVGRRAVFRFGEYEVNWRWFAIATNGDYEPEGLLRKYHDRGVSENIIKEVKWDIALRRFSSGDLKRNNVVFSFMLLAQNLLKYFRNMYLPEQWQTLMVASIRYRLKEAVFVVRKGRYITLRFNREYRYYSLWKRLLRMIT